MDGARRLAAGSVECRWREESWEGRGGERGGGGGGGGEVGRGGGKKGGEERRGGREGGGGGGGGGGKKERLRVREAERGGGETAMKINKPLPERPIAGGLRRSSIVGPSVLQMCFSL